MSSAKRSRVRVADIYSDRLGAPLAIIHKRRDPLVPNQVSVHEIVGEVLASRDRGRAAPTFDSAGLYLARVDYEARWGLPDAPRATLMGAAG